MHLSEIELAFPLRPGAPRLLEQLADVVPSRLPPHFWPVRFVVTGLQDDTCFCEIGGIVGGDGELPFESMAPLFDFKQRRLETADQFNCVLVVPTGVGADLGGHAGDAGAAAKVLGSLCDKLVLHPNVVNGSDINEMPGNALYVEGSVLARMLMGTVGLQPVRSNRVLVVIDDHEDKFFVNAAVNAVSGARATFGFDCPGVVCVDPPVRLRARFASSGRAAGRVESLRALYGVLRDRRADYDAAAISSVIDVPGDFHQGYFDARGAMVNPWGGVEAILTHSLSSVLDVPSAHSPMFESRDIANLDPGIVDPRMAAEATSVTFLQCILKGLARSPRIITDQTLFGRSSVLTVEDVSCLIIPDGCVGIPTLAALEQGIPVIAVQSNRGLMSNDLTALPWKSGQLHFVSSYLEAAGVMAAIRSGVAVDSCRRPMEDTVVSHMSAGTAAKQQAGEASSLDSDTMRR